MTDTAHKPTSAQMNRQSDESSLPAIASDRREFVKRVGFAVLAVQCLPAMAFGSAGNPISGATAPDDLVIESGPGAFHHVHYLRIPEAALTAPPLEGVKVTSSKALFHQHPVALSQKELTEIHNGGTVSQRASSHVFVIALARGLPVSRPFSS
jgi:hypothetical protein